jgi:ankyrin repeat protein
MPKKVSRAKSSRDSAPKDPFLSAVATGDVAAVRKLIAAGRTPGAQATERAAEFSNKAHSLCHQQEPTLFGRKPTANQVKRAAAESLAGYEMVEAMLTAGAPAPNELCPAARAGNTRLALLLIKHGADVNHAPPMGTPLENAIKSGDIEIVRALIKAGADVNHQSYLGSVLSRAAENARVLVAEELIRSGADVNLKPKFGQRALMKAVQDNQGEFVRLLLRHGADVNLKDGATVGEFGDPEVRIEGGCRITHVPNPEYLREATPLIVAVRKGFADVVAQLIAARADLDAVDSNSLSALAYAVKAQDPALIKLLTDAGAKPLKFAEGSRELAWITAAKGGNCQRLQELLNDGVDVNLRYSSSTEEAEGTALSHAAENGHVQAIRLLLKAGAKPDEAIGTGYEDSRKTAMMNAAAKGQAESAQVLLAAGANPLAKDRKGRTVMHYAAEGGSAEIIRFLVKQGAKVDLKDRASSSPLMEAAGNGHVSAVEALLESGANVNLLSRDGFTPLWHACSNGHAAVVRVLLRGGANPNPPPPGIPPLDAAASGGHQEIVELLLPKAAKGQNRKVGKVTAKPDGAALISAIMSGQTKIVRSLLDAGADPNSTMDDSPFTALMTAVRVGSLELAEMLLQAGAEVNAMNEDRETALDLAYEGIKIARDQLKFLGRFSGEKEQKQITQLRQQLKLGAGEDELTTLLRKAGGRRGKELKGVRAPKPAPPEPEPGRDYEDLPIPDFQAATKSADFQQAIKELEALCNTKARPMAKEEGHPLLGCVRYEVATELADKILAGHHEPLLQRGHYLVKSSRGYASGKDQLSLLPTKNRNDVFAAFQTNGANSNVYPADLVRWFDELEKSQPFLLTGAGPDWCEGWFTKPIKDSRQLARKMYEFCSDIVDQGVGDVARLALELKKTQKFFFWWD